MMTVITVIDWYVNLNTVTPTPGYVIDPYIHMLGTMSPYLGVYMKMRFHFRCLNYKFRYLSTCFRYIKSEKKKFYDSLHQLKPQK